jgi:hypothetical protein
MQREAPKLFDMGDYAATTFQRQFFDLNGNPRCLPPGTIVKVIEKSVNWLERIDGHGYDEVELQLVTIEAEGLITQAVLGLRPLNTLERMVVEGLQ